MNLIYSKMQYYSQGGSHEAELAVSKGHGEDVGVSLEVEALGDVAAGAQRDGLERRRRRHAVLVGVECQVRLLLPRQAKCHPSSVRSLENKKKWIAFKGPLLDLHHSYKGKSCPPQSR